MDASPVRKPRPLLRLASCLCAAALLGGCSAPGPSHGTRKAAQAAPMAADDLQDDYQKVIRNVLPSVVQIQGSKDLGSGVVYDDKGHIVTNAHVVGKEKKFKVTTANSEQALTARLVSSFAEDDLAVVRLDDVPRDLKPAAFGDSSKADVGQIVLAMGSPLGLSSSVTQGIVSATGRTVSEGQASDGSGATIADMLQTSAAINPGNSGGALVNLDSMVIGIPTLAATDPGFGDSAAPGIGFAIPSRTVTRIADQIIKNGKVTDSGRAALGITARTVLRGQRPAGAAVVKVKSGDAADKAGLKAGDIITHLAGDDITTLTSLSVTLADEKPGAKVPMTYTRNGSEKNTTVTLGEM